MTLGTPEQHGSGLGKGGQVFGEKETTKKGESWVHGGGDDWDLTEERQLGKFIWILKFHRNGY